MIWYIFRTFRNAYGRLWLRDERCVVICVTDAHWETRLRTSSVRANGHNIQFIRVTYFCVQHARGGDASGSNVNRERAVMVAGEDIVGWAVLRVQQFQLKIGMLSMWTFPQKWDTPMWTFQKITIWVFAQKFQFGCVSWWVYSKS